MPGYSRRRFLWASVGCGAAALGGTALARRSLQRVSRTSHALGTRVTLTVLAPSSRLGERAIGDALAEIDAVEDALSLYRPDSDLCRLNRAGIVRAPDRRLVEVLAMAAAMSRASAGAFDVTVQPLWSILDRAHRAQRSPTAAEIAAARACVDWRRVELGEDVVRLRGRGTQVTLNGIAQGYAADRAALVLRSHGIEHALLDTGELSAQGSHHGAPWRVGIQHPDEPDAFVAMARLEGRALATSGDYATTFGPDRRRHHLLDPATGLSPGELASVSIAAPTALEADALSTACFILGVERGLALVATRAACDALLVTRDGRMVRTPGFPWEHEEAADVG
jgi:FAD:protein FMN transferase